MPQIRPYRPEDRAAVYRICTLTGDGGNDATGLHVSDDLVPDIFAGPYVDFEPELAFVVDTSSDTGTTIAGYIVATADTRAFVERYRSQRLPAFAAKYPREPGPVPEMVDLGYQPERMLVAEVDEYPAHLHIDLLPELQGMGFGRQLVRTLLAALAARGIRGLHLTMAASNTPARAFYDRLGFVELRSSTPDAPVLGIRTDAAV
ncbi:GNAT family N-acetyltransferase [Glaciibacter superstes]|uniref:GNAT family N-acetyltransferase n=1 Tax=Glaciibacter superstes TaxID=501023 RepID=UPI000427B115|nr:GNAT family N-acetyltransferase [Glaciibacter superstes]